MPNDFALNLFEKPDKMAGREGFGDGLVALGETTLNVVALTAGVVESVKMDKFAKMFPERFFNVGIAEQNMIGIASGLSLSGKVPFAATFGSFMARAMDHIRVSVAYGKLNVKLLATHCGLSVGADGASAQMMEDIAMFRVLPNFTVIVPGDFYEAKKSIIGSAFIKGPVYIRVGREKTPVMTTADTKFEIGKAELFNEGRDVTIVACGSLVYDALIAAKQLEKEDISVRVLNNHTIKPIDSETIIKAAKETGAIVTAEEHQIYGGLGSAVSEVVAQNYPVPVKFVGMKDVFGESGTSAELMKAYGMTSQDIVNAVKEVLKRKR